MDDTLLPIRQETEASTAYIDPLHLDLENHEFVRVIKENIKESVKFYEGKNLFERQDRLVQYYLGKQPNPLKQLKSKITPYKENLIFEAIGRIKPIEQSRMPDLTVKPGNDSEDSKKTAEMLTGMFNSDIKRRQNRKLYGLCVKQEPLYFFSVVKARWNPEIGQYGDYEFVNVHPKNIIFDHTATTSDERDMRYIAEKQELTIKDMIMMFPDKEEVIKEAFGWESEGSEESKLATKQTCWEIWFHWYKKGKGKEGKTKFERIDGCVWMYKDVVLKKMKNPYYDFQGERRMFSKELEEKKAYSIDEIFDLIDAEKGNYKEEIVYNNYFNMPRKPYFFFVYEVMGEHPIGETSRIEQVLEFQDAINAQGSIILDMNLRSRGKDIFDTNAIDQETIESIDIYDVDQVLGINVPAGQSISSSHSHIQQQPATPQMYRAMDDNRRKAFEMLAVGATTRGVREQDSTLGESQMMREADFGVIDDIVEDTINALAEWQADWSMQFIKLFYSKPHLKHVLGKDGEVLHMKLTRDIVEDGIEVVVSASGVDKMQRKRMAIQNMQMGIGDPLSFYEDTEQSNPKERAYRAMLAQTAPQVYMQQYLQQSQLPPDNPPLPGQSPVPGTPPVPEAAPQPPAPAMPPAA